MKKIQELQNLKLVPQPGQDVELKRMKDALDALKKLLTPAIVLPPGQPGQLGQPNNDALKKLNQELDRLRKLLETPSGQTGQTGQPAIDNAELDALKLRILQLQTQLANAQKSQGPSVQDESELNRLRGEVVSLREQLKQCQDEAAAALAAKAKELQSKQDSIDLLLDKNMLNIKRKNINRVIILNLERDKEKCQKEYDELSLKFQEFLTSHKEKLLILENHVRELEAEIENERTVFLKTI